MIKLTGGKSKFDTVKLNDTKNFCFAGFKYCSLMCSITHVVVTVHTAGRNKDTQTRT